MSKGSLATYRGIRRWGVAEGRAAVGALESSGLSLSAFARREGLDVQRLRAWRKRLATVATSAEVQAFIELPHRIGERVEVELPSGVLVRVAETVDPIALRRIVQALTDTSEC